MSARETDVLSVVRVEARGLTVELLKCKCGASSRFDGDKTRLGDVLWMLGHAGVEGGDR